MHVDRDILQQRKALPPPQAQGGVRWPPLRDKQNSPKTRVDKFWPSRALWRPPTRRHGDRVVVVAVVYNPKNIMVFLRSLDDHKIECISRRWVVS